MSEHTPGPWVVSPVRTPSGTILVTTVPDADGVEHSDLTIDVIDHPDTRMEATARLVSQAPELLATCIVFERAITELVEAEKPTSTDWLNLRTARHLARNVIAKCAKTETGR